LFACILTVAVRAGGEEQADKRATEGVRLGEYIHSGGTLLGFAVRGQHECWMGRLAAFQSVKRRTYVLAIAVAKVPWRRFRAFAAVYVSCVGFWSLSTGG